MEEKREDDAMPEDKQEDTLKLIEMMAGVR